MPYKDSLIRANVRDMKIPRYIIPRITGILERRL